MANITSLEKLRQHFNSGATKPYAFRKEQLKKLKTSILNHEQDLYDALHADLKKKPGRKLGDRNRNGDR